MLQSQQGAVTLQVDAPSIDVRILQLGPVCVRICFAWKAVIRGVHYV